MYFVLRSLINYLVTTPNTTWASCIGHIIMSTLSRHFYKGHTDQNACLSGKYRVDFLHIPSNCYYTLLSISESHDSSKSNFTALKNTGYGNGCGQSSRWLNSACVTLQLQNMEDELRGTTQTCTVRNDEWSQRSSDACMVKSCKLSSQISLLQTTWKNGDTDRKFVTFGEGMTEVFFVCFPLKLQQPGGRNINTDGNY